MATFFVRLIFTDKDGHNRVAQNISVDNHGNYVSADACGAEYVSDNKQYKANTNMRKKLIRLTESDLHRVVKESVDRILNENSPYDNDSIFYDVIDRSLSQNTDYKASVARFYSDQNQITIAVFVTNDIRNTKRAVIETMKRFFYEYYTSGANGKYVMMTFKQKGYELDESMGKIIVKGDGKGYWGSKGKTYRRATNKSQTKKRENYEYPYDETGTHYTGCRRGIMWDADEIPLKYKQSQFHQP